MSELSHSDLDGITAVLLPDGKWHKVDDGSLKIGPITFEDRAGNIIAAASGPLHFSFAQRQEDETVSMIHGPLDSIKAFRHDTAEDFLSTAPHFHA